MKKQKPSLDIATQFEDEATDSYTKSFNGIFFEGSDILLEILLLLDEKDISSLKRTNEFFKEALKNEKYSYENRLKKLPIYALGRQADPLLQKIQIETQNLIKDLDRFIFLRSPITVPILRGWLNQSGDNSIGAHRILNTLTNSFMQIVLGGLLVLAGVMLIVYGDTNIDWVLSGSALLFFAFLWPATNISDLCQSNGGYALLAMDEVLNKIISSVCNPGTPWLWKVLELVMLLVLEILLFIIGGPIAVLTSIFGHPYLSFVNRRTKSKAATHDWAPTNSSIKKLLTTLEMQQQLLQTMKAKIKDNYVLFEEDNDKEQVEDSDKKQVEDSDKKQQAEETIETLLREVSNYQKLLTSSDQTVIKIEQVPDEKSHLLAKNSLTSSQDTSLDQATQSIDLTKLNYDQVLNFCKSTGLELHKSKFEESAKKFKENVNRFFLPLESKEKAPDLATESESQFTQ